MKRRELFGKLIATLALAGYQLFVAQPTPSLSPSSSPQSLPTIVTPSPTQKIEPSKSYEIFRLATKVLDDIGSFEVLENELLEPSTRTTRVYQFQRPDRMAVLQTRENTHHDRITIGKTGYSAVYSQDENPKWRVNQLTNRTDINWATALREINIKLYYEFVRLADPNANVPFTERDCATNQKCYYFDDEVSEGVLLHQYGVLINKETFRPESISITTYLIRESGKQELAVRSHLTFRSYHRDLNIEPPQGVKS